MMLILKTLGASSVPKRSRLSKITLEEVLEGEAFKGSDRQFLKHVMDRRSPDASTV
jgi:hypothetical protein